MEKLRGPGKPYQTQTLRGCRGNTHPSQLHLIFASEMLPGSPHLAVQKLPYMVTSTGKAGIWAHKPTLSSLVLPRANCPSLYPGSQEGQAVWGPTTATEWTQHTGVVSAPRTH